MTVKDLIEELKRYPEDMIVWVGGDCEDSSPAGGVVETTISWAPERGTYLEIL